MAETNRQICLSVRTLVEFLLRSGSIDNRSGGFDRANEGARIHRRLQKMDAERYKDQYQSEVHLSFTTERRGVSYCIDGRADGILQTNQGVLIDEIKTTTIPIEQIGEDQYPVHWAQVQCYGYFYCLENQLAEIQLRLTYFQVDTEETLRYTRTYTFSELETFYLGLLDLYHPWAEFSARWTELRANSIQQMEFPFPAYREGQRKLAVAIYRTIASEGRLFCQAPTGTGKTISTLFPSVKAMGEGMGQHIFYLTAKTITRQAAEEAFSIMGRQGLRLRRVTLTAKDKVCFLEERNCNPDQCPYAKGYYDRINQVLFSLLQHEDALTRETVEACAKENNLCPFELALDCTQWCDGIICDYNYLFDPVVSLKRFFENCGDYIFLIDEAHNLVDRSRSMYSALLRKTDFLAVKKMMGKGCRPLTRTLNQVNKRFLALKALCEEGAEPANQLCQQEIPEDFLPQLLHFTTACAKWLEENRSTDPPHELLQLYFDVRFFLRIAELYDSHFCSLVTVSGSEVTVKLLCLDPSSLLDACMKKGRSAILFSATLSPISYFASVLGGGEAASQVCKKWALPSPFPASNLCLLVDDSIDTRYAGREASIAPLVQRITTLVTEKTGNYLVYFPSYKYMNEVYEAFCEQAPQIRTILQTYGMAETEREDFLNQFDSAGTETLVGFCVLGGIYSEGIDLKGDRLIGTAVVGVGLPQLSREQEILRDYYDKKNGMGFAYAYQYPGMNKVLQAAGRVIRGEQDRGVVLLLDSRFSLRFYQDLFPSHWSHAKTVRNQEQLSCQLRQFWDQTRG